MIHFALFRDDLGSAIDPERRPLGADGRRDGALPEAAVGLARVATSSRVGRYACLLATSLLVAAVADGLAPNAAAAEPSSPAASAAPTGQPSSSSEKGVLPAFRVFGERDADVLMPMPKFGFRFGPWWFPVPNYETAAVVVTAARASQVPANVAPTANVLLAAPLRAVVGVTLEGALSGVPEAGMIRRGDSLAEGLLQKVAVRGLGFAGSGGALVLLDGIPLNDPFSGGVAWSKVPRDGLARVEVVPAGGANVWGDGALGGVVQLFTRRARGETVFVRLPPPPGSPPYAEGKGVMGERATLHARAEVGDYGTRSAEWAGVYPSEIGYWQLLGRVFSTDGYRVVAPERRGPVEIAAWQRHRGATLRWVESVSAMLGLNATVRGYEEQRGLGTPYGRSGMRERFAAIGGSGQIGLKFLWRGTAYAQDQSASIQESVVNAPRTRETPARDQFAVPSKALGAAWIGTWKHAGQSVVNSDRSSIGADVRSVWGEARENFQWDGTDFARQRAAGGAQSTAGVFGLHERALSEGWRATVGARIDWLRNREGHRWEMERSHGAILRDDRFSANNDQQFSPSAGLVWTPSKGWRARAHLQQAFRRPTLDELYHPGRDGPDAIEANANLRTEHSTSAEVGAEWTFFALRSPPAPTAPAKPPPPASATPSPGKVTILQTPAPKARPPVSTAVLTLGATAFYHEINDAISAVAMTRNSGLDSRFGLIGEGGAGRRRMNLELARLSGVELSARWVPWPELTLAGNLVWQTAEVRRAPQTPALVGRRWGQLPRQYALFSANWQAPAKLVISPRVRYLGRQFADDENLRPLGKAAVVDLGISRAIDKNIELFLTVENVGNARVETGRSGDQVVRVGAPRLATGGLRGYW